MLNLLAGLSEYFGPLNLFRYITFRTGGAILTALVISLWWGDRFIHFMRSKQGKGQPIRSDGPASHILTKQGTPTMGGLLILFSLGISTLLWADLRSGYLWMVLLVTFGFGLIGFGDDYLKLIKRNHDGLPGRVRLLAEFTVAGLAVVGVMLLTRSGLNTELSTGLSVPFVKNTLIDLGWFFLPFGMVVVVGAGNAANLTDGLDGLLTVPVMIVAACFALISYLVGNVVFANYLQIHHVPGVGEITVFCGALGGAALGFLWFNAPPARVFMGDTGSLALGGALGVIAVITKHEIVLAIIGGLFVLETLSVILQVFWFKRTGMRVFLMAPLHHHFEKKGWSETTVVIRFWIISLVLALVGLATLKLR